MVLRKRSDHAARGMTLTEVVVATGLVGLLSGAAAVQLGGPNATARSTKAFARSLFHGLNQARADAITYGGAQVWCVTTGCSVKSYTPMFAQVGSWKIKSGSHAQIAGITPSTVIGSSTPARAVLPPASGPTSSGVPLGFASDGSAGFPAGSGYTIYLEDTNQQNRYKIYTYGATGMSRLVEGW